MFQGEGLLLRIFIGENDKYQRQPLYEWIVRRAREFGLAGATVFRGLAGYGAHSRVHTAKPRFLCLKQTILTLYQSDKLKIECSALPTK